MSSIRESVHKLLSNAIDELGLNHLYNVTHYGITGINGTEFFFEGLWNNVTKIKSMEAVDICWCEEAESVKKDSWRLLIPSIRANNSEIWVSFNPSDESDDTYQRFIANYDTEIRKNGFYEDEDLFVSKVSWRDNPWFPDVLRREKDKLKMLNYQEYLHVWEGECTAAFANSIILPDWVEASIDAHLKLGFEPLGTKVLGFDPADEEGGDDKALAIRHGSVITMLETWNEGDLSDAIALTHDIAFENRCTDYVYDAIGVGSGVKVDFKRRDANNIRISSFKGSRKVKDPKDLYNDTDTNENTFRNLRAQAWWKLRDRFELTYNAVTKGWYADPDKMISIDSRCDNIPVLKAELVRVQRKRGVSNTLITLESKDEMKKRGVASPNLAEAVNYSFENDPPPAQSVIAARPIEPRRFG